MNQFKTEVEPISIEGFQVVSGELFPMSAIMTALHHLEFGDHLQPDGADRTELL